jgi:hypothetical protein
MKMCVLHLHHGHAAIGLFSSTRGANHYRFEQIAGARAGQILVRIEVVHGPVRRIANLGAAHILAVHAVVMIDEVTRSYSGVRAE